MTRYCRIVDNRLPPGHPPAPSGHLSPRAGTGEIKNQRTLDHHASEKHTPVKAFENQTGRGWCIGWCGNLPPVYMIAVLDESTVEGRIHLRSNVIRSTSTKFSRSTRRKEARPPTPRLHARVYATRGMGSVMQGFGYGPLVAIFNPATTLLSLIWVTSSVQLFTTTRSRVGIPLPNSLAGDAPNGRPGSTGGALWPRRPFGSSGGYHPWRFLLTGGTNNICCWSC